MLTLGIETSSRAGGVSLWDSDRGILRERQLSESTQRHAQSLVPSIGELLQESGVTWADRPLIAVSMGPGSFTGLRIGIMCAKTLAYATGSPVVGVDTFLVLAEQVDAAEGHVSVVAEAQRGALFVGEYSRQGARWVAEGAIAVVPARDFLAGLAADKLLIGPAAAKLAAECPDRCRVTPAATQPTAAMVAKLGARQFADQGGDDVWRLGPVYLRPSSAEEQAASRIS